jgi:hypothetical protein
MITPDEILGVSHFDIDFSKKVVTRAGVESKQQSRIESVKTDIDGKTIIQGIEDGQPDERDGAGWSISIMDHGPGGHDGDGSRRGRLCRGRPRRLCPKAMSTCM